MLMKVSPGFQESGPESHSECTKINLEAIENQLFSVFFNLCFNLLQILDSLHLPDLKIVAFL